MVVQELIAKLGFDVDQGGLNSVDNALGSFAKKLTIAAAGIYAVKKAVEATVWAISGSIEAAAQKEDVTTQFKVMLGDLEAAKYLYQEINAYAAITPWTTAGLADNVKGLMASGMAAKDAFADVKMIGDVALGNQEKLNRLAYVYAQTQAAGHLKGDDLRQYTEASFNPLQILAEKYGKTREYYQDLMKKGKFSADMVREAFVIATSKGGKFFEGSLEGGKTWHGMMSTFKDNVEMLGAALGEKLLPYLKEVVNKIFEMWRTIEGAYIQLGNFMSVFLKDGPSAEDTAAGIAASFATIADAIMTAMTLFQGFMTLMWGLNTVVGTVAAFIVDTFKAAGQVAALIMRDIFGGVAHIGQTLGIKKLEHYGNTEYDKANAFANSGWYTNTSGYATTAGGYTADSWNKMLKLGSMIGGEGAAPKRMQSTPEIEAALAKGTIGKQALTINNQINNLTVNADDPLKTMGEAAASKFFQSAFIQLRHATV